MNVSRGKWLAIAGVIVIAMAGGVIYAAAKRALDPTRAPMPDPAAPLVTFQAKLDKLRPLDRQLVLGYLLLQRGEISSLSTHGFNFAARTFREAIEAQKTLLAAKFVSPEWPLMRLLEEQSLQPLREAVAIELVARQHASVNDLFKCYAGSIVASGGAQDQPRNVMIYRVRNPGAAAIKHLTAYVQPQLASDAWVHPQAASACRVELNDLAPGARAQVVCAQADLDAIGDAAQTPDERLLIDWRPDLVEYADGSKLSYDTLARTKTLLWGRYDIGGNIN